MEYISGSSNADPVRDSYYFNMRYPEDYKSNDTRIVKFEANHFQLQNIVLSVCFHYH